MFLVNENQLNDPNLFFDYHLIIVEDHQDYVKTIEVMYQDQETIDIDELFDQLRVMHLLH